MILSIEETKKYLRVDFDDDDTEIQNLIDAAEVYMKNATGKEFDNTNPLAKLYCRVLIQDWYDNRELMEYNRVSTRVKFTLQSIMFQLQYSGDSNG